MRDDLVMVFALTVGSKLSTNSSKDPPIIFLHLSTSQNKTEPRNEPYLDIITTNINILLLLLITNRKIRVQYTKCRLSDYDLEIEKGRHMKVERGNRHCKLCTTGEFIRSFIRLQNTLHITTKFSELFV